MADARITQKKFDELAEELRVLKTERRKEVAENLEYSKSLGDLSENAEYHEARAAQAALEDRIAKLEQLLKNSTIVADSALRTGNLGIGASVRVRRINDGRELSYQMVGSEEGDIAAGRLSIDSPLGQALVGKSVGEVVGVKTPNGGSEYEIVSIG